MPELPEVEVICRGLSPLLIGERIKRVNLWRENLRYPLPEEMEHLLPGRRVMALNRRAKYTLFHLDQNIVLVWHLGMTGQFHLLNSDSQQGPHEHVRIDFDNGSSLCYRDARRFGYAGLTTEDALGNHRWFKHLGLEPLGEEFDAQYLYRCCNRRKAAIKPLIMNAKVVVGVGNIYASEALFRSGISPLTTAADISLNRIDLLTTEIKQVLNEAIRAGGSTISDFVNADGKPGYFAHQFKVYGRESAPCFVCKKPIQRIVQAGRSSFYCGSCQR